MSQQWRTEFSQEDLNQLRVAAVAVGVAVLALERLLPMVPGSSRERILLELSAARGLRHRLRILSRGTQGSP